MFYKLVYDTITGTVKGICRLDDMAGIPLCEDNADYQDFLKWNATQPKPLDLKSTIEPTKPTPTRDLAQEIDELKAKVAILESKKL